MHASDAQRVAAHRAAKLPAVPTVGCRAHCPAGKGIITRTFGTTVTLAFLDNDKRTWREYHERDVTVLSVPKELPKWTNGRHCRGRKGHRREFFNPVNDVQAASVGGEKPNTVPTYRIKRAGRSVLRKDYTRTINNRLAHLIEGAMEGA